VLGDERLELARERRMTARGEIGLHPVLEAGKAQLLEKRDLGLSEALIRELGER
jgi:hypothetical protein